MAVEPAKLVTGRSASADAGRELDASSEMPLEPPIEFAVEAPLEPLEVPVVPITAETPLGPGDQFFYALSSAADHGLLWLALGSARAARKGDPAFALRLGALLGAESILTNGVIKLAFRRVRPQQHFTHEEALPYGMRRPVTSSFPSGHAATAFMAAGLLSKGAPRMAPAYYTLAGLVAYSRVHVKMHHAADVVGGAVLGVALGALARRFVRLT